MHESRCGASVRENLAPSPTAVILAAKALLSAHASISVPSTVKCSSDINLFACSFTSAKNCCATSLFNSRSRFLLNTAWFHTASSISRPTNQRNSKL